MLGIIYFGHYGTTEKAAKLLAEELNDCKIFDGKTCKNKQLSFYDKIIFGANIRNGRINNNFLKFYKSFTKIYPNRWVYLFLIGADLNKKNKYLSMGYDLIKNNNIAFFGGELDETNAKGLTKHLIKACIKEFKSNDLDLPTLDINSIKDFAIRIKEDLNC